MELKVVVFGGGDKRSYNEIAADLELLLWTQLHKGESFLNKKQEQNDEKEHEGNVPANKSQ